MKHSIQKESVDNSNSPTKSNSSAEEATPYFRDTLESEVKVEISVELNQDLKLCELSHKDFCLNRNGAVLN